MRAKVVFLSFATLGRPKDVDAFVKGRGKTLKALRTEIVFHFTKPESSAGKEKSSVQRESTCPPETKP